MRKVATLPSEVEQDGTTIRRVMVYDAPGGAYVFVYATVEDGCCEFDEWFTSLSYAEAYCTEQLGVRAEDWRTISDPLPGCQDDWIAPVRVRGRDRGTPEWGVYERLGEDGLWHPVENR